MVELEVIEEYLSAKRQQLEKQGSRLDSTMNQSPTTLDTEQQQSTEAKQLDAEVAYQRIAANVPSHLRIYISS